jgi:hypothetical protein
MPVMRHAPLQAAVHTIKLTEEREITPYKWCILMRNVGVISQATADLRVDALHVGNVMWRTLILSTLWRSALKPRR